MPDVRHPLFARAFARAAPRMEEAGVAAHRRELLDGVRGRVIEVGAGTGASFAHYPATVDEVVAVEPEPYLRARALEAAAAAPVGVTVVAATAEELPFADGSFDVGVASLVLCSVRDPGAALAELHRVLRGGGELRFYEHVRGGGRPRSGAAHPRRRVAARRGRMPPRPGHARGHRRAPASRSSAAAASGSARPSSPGRPSRT